MNRKIKYLMLLIVFGCSFLNTKAQDYHIGLKAGADIYKNQGNTIMEAYKTYPYGGAYLGISGPRLGLYFEGIFSQTTMVAGDNFNQIYKGYIASGKQSIKNPKFSFAEISVPILISYKLFNPVWAEGGLQFTKIVNMNDKNDVLKEIQNIYKDSYISGVLGLRIFITRKIQLHGRYIYGFSDRNNSSINEKWTTQHFQAGLSYGL